MTATREALVLPVLFLTVALLGGLRPGSPLVLPAPPLFTLVLAALLTGALVQSGALDPRRLLGGHRAALAIANGGVLLAALFLASAQTFALLTPAAGLPRVLFSVYFFVLMLNTLAAAPDRVRVLRSLGVTFGAAFVLKFVVLDALAAPGEGGLARALQLLLDGVTLGVLAQAPLPAAAGYLAFATLALYLFGVWLLPAADRRGPRADAAARIGGAAERRLLDGVEDLGAPPDPPFNSR